MTVVVRPSTEGDWEQLRALRLEALLDAPLSYGSTYEETLAWTTDAWVAMALSPTTFVGVHEDHVVGTARGGRHDGEPLDSPHRWLWGMYVTPRARGGNVATDLVEAVGQWALADGGTSLHLYVSNQAPRARAFYEKVGFVDDVSMEVHAHSSTLSFHPMRRAL